MTSRREVLRLAAGVVAVTGLAGCADTGPDAAPVVTGTTPSHIPGGTPTVASGAVPRVVAKSTYRGPVPVLMHHRLVDGAAGDYDMTAAFFRAELERLYREKYHPIRTIDLVRRDFDAVPAGKKPVVLTFDDGTPGQFAMTSSGQVDPASAVGILLAFHAEHRDFPATASLYVNQNPFGYSGVAARRALVRLHSLGFEIGNHTLTHPNLRSLSSAEVQSEIGGLAALVAQAGIPAPRTLALPYGVHPHDHALVARGGRGTTAYVNEGVLLVGANPSPSPYDKKFDPLAIPRIRCTSHDGGRDPLELNYWLNRLR
jgi:peptidoglycan/xylan/chitin deacetylase (PgdA/CDA1 family)